MKIRIKIHKKRIVMMMSLALLMPGNINEVDKAKILDELQKEIGCIDFGIFLVYNFNMISYVTVPIDRQGAIPIINKRGMR